MHFTIRPWCPSPFSHHSKDEVCKQLLHPETEGSGPSYTSTDISCPPKGEMPETLQQSKNELHEAYVYILLLLCDTCGCTCADVKVGVKRQLCTAASVLPSCGFLATSWSLELCSTHLYPLSHLMELSLIP